MWARRVFHGGLLVCLGIGLGSWVHAQKTARKPERATPPKFQANEFSGVFFPDPIAHLQGTAPSAGEMASKTNESSNASSSGTEMEPAAVGNDVWKQLISGPTIEDLIKESKSRVDHLQIHLLPREANDFLKSIMQVEKKMWTALVPSERERFTKKFGKL